VVTSALGNIHTSLGLSLPFQQPVHTERQTDMRQTNEMRNMATRMTA